MKAKKVSRGKKKIRFFVNRCGFVRGGVFVKLEGNLAYLYDINKELVTKSDGRNVWWFREQCLEFLNKGGWQEVSKIPHKRELVLMVREIPEFK